MFIKFKQQNNLENLEDDLLEIAPETDSVVTDDSSTAEPINLRPTIISEGSSIDGNLTYKGTVHLDGKFKGNIKADKLIMGKNGSFNGTMIAESVTISGNVKGDIQSQILIIKAGSKVAAKIQYEQIQMQPGSVVTGELLMVKK
jgi:cytoskeletal protein CcmA (bactofilin family)